MPKKIFELAKELNVGALDLVEDLKGKGFSVRNHMNSLSDKDIAKYMGMLEKDGAGETAATKKKVVKKKKTATRKKATKKTPTKKQTVKTVATGAEDGAETGTKTTKKTSKKSTSSKAVVRRKVVRRKKSEVEEVRLEAEKEKLALEESAKRGIPVNQPEMTDQSQEIYDDDLEKVRSHTLQVISRPPEEEEESTEGAKTDKPKEPDRSVPGEKMHRFTPVSKPEPKEEGKDGEGTEKKAQKKRMGGLATIVSKTKGVAGSRAREITKIRAEEEAKSYGVGKVSRAIYSNVGKKKVYVGPTQQTMITTAKESKRVLSVKGGCTVEELAKGLSKKLSEVIDKALDLNLLVEASDFLGVKLANRVASLFDWKVEDSSFDESEMILKEEKVSNLPSRAPVVTIMGHVDHGKTSLLDYIRKAKVVEGEAGGITQHIGAYQVKVGSHKLTFLDTPGHAAFAAIRQRGADVTDIVILVVAADDGVMPQTRESVRFCQQAGKPVIVAVNKIDKEGVNPDRVKNELTEFNITPEEWGGDTQFVEVSALTGEGVDSLLEAVALQAEMMELSADPKGPAEGVVIESRIESGRGPIATILIQSGTLKNGQSLVVGETYGRARTLMDYQGKLVKSVGPSSPVQILGLASPPNPGDIVNSVKNEREAKKIVDHRIEHRKGLEQSAVVQKTNLEDFFSDSKDLEEKVLKLIIRSDVQGSYEAIRSSLESLGNAEVSVQVIGGGVGAITDSDVELASSGAGYIIGFNMRPTTSARKLAETRGVDIKNYSVIYELIDDIKLALEGMLDPERVEVFIGRAKVKDTFSIPKIGTIAGSEVVDGKIERGCNIRLLRNGKITYDGRMSSLKRFKDDAKEVRSGLECGIGLENYNDIKVDDVFEAYMIEEKKRSLEQVGQETKA
jgi:translation initiation factor IF-2